MKKQHTYSGPELVKLVEKMGCSGGGTIEVSGLNNDEPMTILISQTEWHNSPVCLVGGYGQLVTAISTESIRGELPDTLDSYFDYPQSLTVREICK